MVKESTTKSNTYSALMPRFWHGMPPHVWFPLLATNRCRISLSRLHHFLGVSLFTPFTGMLAIGQEVLFGSAVRRTELTAPPIFVLGHWRSGTTMLHEYLSLDERLSSPTTFQCFAPWHFLLTEDLVTRFGGFLLPDRRPMDNMKAGWSLPQEDEFALMNLGAPTPYLRILFPNHPVPYEDTLGSQSFDPKHLEVWKKRLDWFLRDHLQDTQTATPKESASHRQTKDLAIDVSGCEVCTYRAGPSQVISIDDEALELPRLCSGTSNSDRPIATSHLCSQVPHDHVRFVRDRPKGNGQKSNHRHSL